MEGELVERITRAINFLDRTKEAVKVSTQKTEKALEEKKREYAEAVKAHQEMEQIVKRDTEAIVDRTEVIINTRF